MAILGITLSLAIPSFQGLQERHRIIGAVEDLAANLRYARSEALKRNQEIAFSYSTGDSWKYGIGNTENCLADVVNCTMDGVAKVITSSDYPNISMDDAATSFTSGYNFTIFGPRRGEAINGVITLVSDDYTVAITLSSVGHVTYCSNQTVLGYPSCT